LRILSLSTRCLSTLSSFTYLQKQKKVFFSFLSMTMSSFIYLLFVNRKKDLTFEDSYRLGACVLFFFGFFFFFWMMILLLSTWCCVLSSPCTVYFVIFSPFFSSFFACYRGHILYIWECTGFFFSSPSSSFFQWKQEDEEVERFDRSCSSLIYRICSL
jgi:hypothetical protein